MGKGDLVPRIITAFGVRMRSGEEKEFVRGWPVNLSETGTCVRCPVSWAVGESVELEIKLGQDGPRMSVRGRIVWVRADGVNNVFYMGVGFVDLAGEQLEQIRAYAKWGAEDLLRFMSEFPVFEGFSEDDCRALLRILTLRRLERKEILYQEGKNDLDMQGLFIVQSGLLNIFKGPVPRREKQLGMVSPGQIFGEITLIVDQPHTATVMAVNESNLVQVNKVGFRLLRNEQPALALKIMDVVARALISRLGRTTRKLFAPVHLLAR